MVTFSVVRFQGHPVCRTTSGHDRSWDTRVGRLCRQLCENCLHVQEKTGNWCPGGASKQRYFKNIFERREKCNSPDRYFRFVFLENIIADWNVLIAEFKIYVVWKVIIKYEIIQVLWQETPSCCVNYLYRFSYRNRNFTFHHEQHWNKKYFRVPNGFCSGVSRCRLSSIELWTQIRTYPKFSDDSGFLKFRLLIVQHIGW